MAGPGPYDKSRNESVSRGTGGTSPKENETVTHYAQRRVQGRYTKDAKGQRTYHAPMGGEKYVYGKNSVERGIAAKERAGGIEGPRTSNKAAAPYIKRMS